MRSALVLLTLLAAAAPATAQDGELHVDRERGFELRAPQGWVSTPQPQPDGTWTLYFLPAGSSGRVLFGVSLRELEQGQDEQHLVSLSLAKIAADDAFDGLERFEAELDGATRPGLRVDYASPTGPLVVEVGYRAAGRRGFVLQRAAPPGEFESWRDTFDAMLASFRTLEVAEPDAGESLARTLAARCGSQVDVAPTWEVAAERARELGRPILVVAWAYGGFDLPVRPESTLLTDPDLVELLNARFVVWKLDKGAQNDFSRAYGLSPTTFGQALIVAAPDGSILAEIDRATDVDLAYAFLRDALARHTPADAPASDPAEALARGELEAALAALGEDDTPRAALLRGRALRLLKRGEEALAALAPALDDDATSAEALAQRAQVELGLGRGDAARASATRLVEAHADAPSAAVGAVVLGLLEVQAGAFGAASARWRALCATHPDSPWTWQVADMLDSGLLETGVLEGFDPAWPSADELADALDRQPWSPLAPDAVRAARDGALAWLLAHQRPDGSWPSPAAREAREDLWPNPFVDAVTSLAARALLPHRNDARVASALERAYAFLLRSIALRAERRERVLYMDYTPWSDAALLDALASALEAGVGDVADLRAAAGALVADLQRRRQPHGGWGYYVTGDLDGAAAPPTSMSFTTAAVVLALAHARTAGLGVEPAVLVDAADALVATRTSDGHFVYMQGRGPTGRVGLNEVPGAAGRAPACELALRRAGRSSPEYLRRAVETFLAHAPTLAAERGKALMHCGAAGQGCHYVLFDYAWAAAAAAESRSDSRTRTRLRELVLDCRREDGSFLDTPINGPAYGTAQALLALDAL